MLCEVDRSYIEDGFNLYGLRHHVPNFQECLDIILDKSAAEECRDPKVVISYIFVSVLMRAVRRVCAFREKSDAATTCSSSVLFVDKCCLCVLCAFTFLGQHTSVL